MVIIGVGFSVLLVVVVGIVVARKVDGDSANYLVAGRRLGIPLVAASLMASAVDSNATVGNTDLTSSFGFWAGASLAIGLAICLLLTGLFLARPMNRMGLFTLADFYRLRYGRGVEVTSSVLMIFAFAILMAGNLVACGYLLNRFLGLSYTTGVLLAVSLVLVYTIAGGMFSDAYTAAFQVVITAVATVALLWWVGATFGFHIPEGMGPFDMEQLTSTDAGAPINWATLVALGIGDIVAIDFMQRIFAAKNPEVARRSCFAGAAGTATVGVAYALVALTAVSALGLDAVDGPVLFALLDDYAPAGLTVLVLSGIVAASFSTASGAILATAAVAVRNIAGVRRVVQDGSRDPLLLWTRLAMLPVVACGVTVALEVAQTGILLTLAFDLMLAGLVVPFLLGLFWGRGGTSAAVAALAAGLTVRVGLFVLTPTMYGVPNDVAYIPNEMLDASFDGWPTFYGAIASLLAYLVAAWLRPRPAIEQARQIVDGALTDTQVQAAPVPAPAGLVPEGARVPR
ncbi:high affinity choline transporter 1 [Cellulomonas bogoriensis]|uniref:Sodium:solute symporter n=1 Tax=Cellulomonas bogoriensis 69B4 = DSM 16987 TaxID=1386082 RepID=A0A0A0BTW2_9CELL|nr:sodium:solute symporter family protein [Cellulomonas bogoriensis]KGM11395.1 sodium:solute symporter [Cellulomonas bogoriensis 69B4 = DSM 16987]